MIEKFLYQTIRIIPFLFYGIVIIGIVLLVYGSVYWLFESIAIKKIEKQNRKTVKKKVDDFELLLQYNFGKLYPLAKQILFTSMILSFLLVFLFLNGINQNTRFLIASIFSFVPIGVLYVRRMLTRVHSSHEGIEVLTELINQYKIADYNIYTAIDNSIVHLKNAPNMKKILFVLSSSLKEITTEEQLNGVLKLFVSSVDTEWCKMLANNFFFAVQEKGNILVGMIDILNELKEQKILYERSKRLNFEGFFLALIALPLLYIGSAYLFASLFEGKISMFFETQFISENGTQTFFTILGLFVLNIVIYVLFRKRKFDF